MSVVEIPNGYKLALIEESPSDAPTEPQTMLASYPDMLKVSDVAEIFGLSTQRVNSLCREGNIPCVQISARRRVVPKSTLLEWIKAGGFHA